MNPISITITLWTFLFSSLVLGVWGIFYALCSIGRTIKEKRTGFKW